MPLGEIDRRATELVLHSRINYCYRRQQDRNLNADRTWGAVQMQAYFAASPGGLFFQPSLDCTNRFQFIPAAWESYPETISRAPPTWTFRW